MSTQIRWRANMLKGPWRHNNDVKNGIQKVDLAILKMVNIQIYLITVLANTNRCMQKCLVVRKAVVAAVVVAAEEEAVARLQTE